MTFEELRLMIPQYLSGELSDPKRASFEEQLETNTELQREVGELRTLWEKLALLPEEQPSLSLRANFYQRLNTMERDRQMTHGRGSWRWEFWPQALAGLLLFVSGLFLGRIKSDAHVQEVSRMNAQVQTLRELVALSLLERQSAASRLEGVAYSSGIEQPKPEVVSALFHTLNHDANVNVRLSCLDALERFTKDAAIGKALVDSIEQQDSPLVQIALIDSLVSIRNRAAAGELKKLMAATDINPAVRQRAQWGFQKLSFE